MLGHNPNVSLLHDNPSAQILPQSGGAWDQGSTGAFEDVTNGGTRMLWRSSPVVIPVTNNKLPIKISHISLNRYHNTWSRTLDPRIPLKRTLRSDTYVIVGALNVLECPTYIVAPLRGDTYAAADCISWADQLLQSDAKAHVAFIGPWESTNDTFIEKQIEKLSAKYPGHAFCITSKKESSLRCLDGLLLYATPNTSKQVAFGFLPDPDTVYDRSSRRLDCLDIDTLRIPDSAYRERTDSESIYTINFRKATTLYNREKEPKSQILMKDHIWGAPPGWITRILFGNETQHGGLGAGVGPKTDDTESIILGPDEYKVRKPSEAVMKEWEEGKFTPIERNLLLNQQLIYDNKIYALYLKAIVGKKCNAEFETQMSPECKILRFIMADKYYQRVKAKNGTSSGPGSGSGSPPGSGSGSGSGPGPRPPGSPPPGPRPGIAAVGFPPGPPPPGPPPGRDNPKPSAPGPDIAKAIRLVDDRLKQSKDTELAELNALKPRLEGISKQIQSGKPISTEDERLINDTIAKLESKQDPTDPTEPTGPTDPTNQDNVVANLAKADALIVKIQGLLKDKPDELKKYAKTIGNITRMHVLITEDKIDRIDKKYLNKVITDLETIIQRLSTLPAPSKQDMFDANLARVDVLIKELQELLKDKPELEPYKTSIDDVEFIHKSIKEGKFNIDIVSNYDHVANLIRVFEDAIKDAKAPPLPPLPKVEPVPSKYSDSILNKMKTGELRAEVSKESAGLKIIEEMISQTYKDRKSAERDSAERTIIEANRDRLKAVKDQFEKNIALLKTKLSIPQVAEAATRKGGKRHRQRFTLRKTR